MNALLPSPLRPVLLAVLAALTLAGCVDRNAPVAEAEPPSPIVQNNQIRFAPDHPQLKLLTLTAAAPGKSVRTELPARLIWNEERTQRIYAPFAGRVTAIKADIGQPVQPGTVLAQLASPDFGIAQADTAKAQADVAFARKNLQRQRELFDAGIVARKDLEQAEADAARSQAEVARAGARTAMYGGGGGVNQRLAIQSAIAGAVVERNLNPGQELRPDQSGIGVPPLFVVSDPTSLWVQIDARESEVATLRPGAVFQLKVAALPGEDFEGYVTATADFIDPSSRTIKVRGIVRNPERKLKAEMLATAQFERMLGSGGVVVPASAVILRGAQHSVLIQVQPGVFEPREVRIGYSGPAEIVLSSGLEVGEMVVSENALLLARELRQAQDTAAANVAGAGKP
ncbi:efflux RND transporter periplasmic adaptor subunit [Variovorax sp. J2P1-59]|uniref:efflux RND transporter periplasmic adaptor subunit n=1 Tax=Variovorax flavidus TaxID=3053501 RepID=UPI002576A16A|nr:efflux RND transporter periplasmic adaptor subunit [Variovorax sp. J2P1-59]MDM0075335.1 efflux RND transporter periplasmic adaptor subunit [Variovorax sp. J2P1-59]